ncbi:MAG: manganese-dependent inorganic pyrophosphatase [Candidatus Nealsonbacteria bacterium]|nr:manganese-dependent inorganic pyrophosphatase [Candidatus Nealsonbacteria bacterium]
MLYVIGHKNTDTDSIVSAIAYAYFLRKQGREAKALRPGPINPETKFVLEKFSFVEPDLIKDVSGTKLILVDHNEKEHRPDGDFEILEIWDHHRFNFSYPSAIFIHCEAVGSTATILAKEFFKKNLEIPRNLAGLLISAILSDTIIFKCPTTTILDKEIAQKLNENLKLDLVLFGKEIKKAGMDFDAPIKDLIQRDFKEYFFSGRKTGISQIQVLEIDEFLRKNKKQEIIKSMEEIKKMKKYDLIVLILTDIFKQGSEIFCSEQEEKIERAFEGKFKNNSFWVSGLMSRKKQIVPLFEKIFEQKETVENSL